MKKIFNKSLVKILFVFGIAFISANICSAAIAVTVTAYPSTVSYGGGSQISWTSSGASTCSESGGRGGSGTTGSFYVSNLYATTTFTVTCTGVPTTTACYDGFYQIGDTVHPNGGYVTYTLANGTLNTISYIYMDNPVKIVYKTGTTISKLGVAPVACQ